MKPESSPFTPYFGSEHFQMASIVYEVNDKSKGKQQQQQQKYLRICQGTFCL